MQAPVTSFRILACMYLPLLGDVMHKRYIMVTRKYAVGQIWEYKTREAEDGSRIYIVHIDQHEQLGKIYHIYLDGVKIRNRHIDGGIQFELPHAPVDETTLTLSLTTLSGETDNLPDISEGYEVWKKAFDAGDGGVFNISISQIIQYIEEIVQENA